MYLEIEINDCSLRVFLLGKKALQNLSGDRCYNSQHLMSGPDIKQAKDLHVVANNRAQRNSLLEVSAAVGYNLQDQKGVQWSFFTVFDPKFLVAKSHKFLANDAFSIFDRNLLVASTVDQLLTVLLVDA